MMRYTFLIAAILAWLLSSSSSIAGGYYGPYFYNDCRRDTFGEAFKSARDNQILNPDASYDLEPVEGVDGLAAEQIYKGYVESFNRQSAGGGSVGFAPLQSSTK